MYSVKNISLKISNLAGFSRNFFFITTKGSNLQVTQLFFERVAEVVCVNLTYYSGCILREVIRNTVIVGDDEKNDSIGYISKW